MIPLGPSPISCVFCGGEYTIEEVLRTPISYWRALGVLRCEAPCCSREEELQIEGEIVYRGYVYAAASPHFARMHQYPSPPSLRLTDWEGSLNYVLGGERYVVPIVSASDPRGR